MIRARRGPSESESVPPTPRASVSLTSESSESRSSESDSESESAALHLGPGTSTVRVTGNLNHPGAGFRVRRNHRWARLPPGYRPGKSPTRSHKLAASHWQARPGGPGLGGFGPCGLSVHSAAGSAGGASAGRRLRRARRLRLCGLRVAGRPGAREEGGLLGAAEHAHVHPARELDPGLPRPSQRRSESATIRVSYDPSHRGCRHPNRTGRRDSGSDGAGDLKAGSRGDSESESAGVPRRAVTGRVDHDLLVSCHWDDDIRM
jgi:hypothetical protein